MKLSPFNSHTSSEIQISILQNITALELDLSLVLSLDSKFWWCEVYVEFDHDFLNVTNFDLATLRLQPEEFTDHILVLQHQQPLAQRSPVMPLICELVPWDCHIQCLQTLVEKPVLTCLALQAVLCCLHSSFDFQKYQFWLFLCCHYFLSYFWHPELFNPIIYWLGSNQKVSHFEISEIDLVWIGLRHHCLWQPSPMTVGTEL